MFALSVAFLLVTAVVLRRFEDPPLLLWEVQLYFWAYLALWMVFVTECVLQLSLARVAWRVGLGRALLVCLLPPFRMGARRWSDATQIWLPTVGWQTADRALFQRLEKAFSRPMIFVALLIVPVLAGEFWLADRMRDYPGVKLALDFSVALIWLAFAVEFIIMVSVAERKLRYCKQHWLDLAIILLPLVAFLRALRLARAVRLARLTKIARVYRLRGVMTRTLRALVILEVVQRLVYRSPERRLNHLRELMTEKDAELAEMRAEIRALEQEILRRPKAGGETASRRDTAQRAPQHDGSHSPSGAQGLDDGRSLRSHAAP